MKKLCAHFPGVMNMALAFLLVLALIGMPAFAAEEDTLTHAKPESEGVANAIERAYALTDVQWTPLRDVPGVQELDGEYTVVPFEAGVTYTGIPYSGVTANDCYVGLNVSLESFLTALENENSVLYTENLHSTNPKSATYFGTVCSKFAQYVLDIPGSYNTNNVANIPGMDTIAMPGKYTVDQIKLGDVVLHTADHTTVCTDILYDADGNVAYIEISEAVMPLVRRRLWSPEEFYEQFAGYRLCRYRYIDGVPAATALDLDETYALMPRYGDKYNYKVSKTKGIVDILQSGYAKAVILRDGKVEETIAIDDTTKTISFDRSKPGYVEIYLEKADGTRSGSVYACVVQSTVTAADTSRYAYGELTVTIDGSSGTPLYVQVGSAHAVFCELDPEKTTQTVSFQLSKVASQQIRVAYQNEYGIYLSSWQSFTADTNPSDDPLLSQGEYWDGRTLTPGSASPVEVSGKEGYWTYTQVPVEGNTTYYSIGANRTWFYDANGNPLVTINVYKDNSPEFQFTTPENAAYVGLTYSPDLLEKGQERLVKVPEKGEGLTMTLTPADYFTVSKYHPEKLACAPCVVTYGDGKLAVAYLADETNSVETEASTTIVCRLGLFDLQNPEDGTFVDVATAGQTIGAVTIGNKAPYEPNLVKLSDEELLVLFNVRTTGGQYIYYCARFDTNTNAITSYEPLTLDGRSWEAASIAESYNALADTDISASGPAGSMVFTSQILEHEGWFYGYCGGICSGFSGILVRSTDGIHWTSVMAPQALPEMNGVIECGYRFFDDYVYFCMRDISSGVYHTAYRLSTGEQLVQTQKIPGLTTSKPTTFVQDGKLYLIVNKATGDDTAVGRRNTAQFYEVDPKTCKLNMVRQVFCADGIAYHSVVEVDGVNYWSFHTDARRINPYTQGRSNLAFLPIPELFSVNKSEDGVLKLENYRHMYAPGCITVAANIWQAAGPNYHYQIPLADFSEFDTVTITANAENKCYIAFFTELMTKAGTIAYAEGWTQPLIMEPGTSQTLTIPQDAAYLYILNNTAAGLNLIPEKVVFGRAAAYLPGDINGDGKVNNKDATRLFQHLSGWTVEVVEAALDVNGDGKVNNKDATRLFQYLSGWNVEIH